ncbi:putative pyrroline-5-carboxylate reductase 3-like isoform X1 [Apostichopus japonicus]|uniref:Putative pyrroline-5-carboxylate reductase 3-like isoform X1 n=1 Tax=Stichopus japonicus TaxID=307972 RepID=A0A2G8K0T1_STIJA|nr:putative pyrroline-5-carboxylate reductase 3-like isoform X1 [Apostichopus japonicus]
MPLRLRNDIGQNHYTTGNLQPSQIKTSAPSDRNFSKIQEFKVATTNDNCEVAEFSQVLFLACKPYQIEGVANQIKSKISTEKHLVVSCAASLPMESCESYFPAGTRMIRIIPNMACSVGQGGVVLVQGSHATREDVETVKSIFTGVESALKYRIG